MAEVEAIAKLANQLSKLPGIGRKTAQDGLGCRDAGAAAGGNE